VALLKCEDFLLEGLEPSTLAGKVCSYSIEWPRMHASDLENIPRISAGGGQRSRLLIACPVEQLGAIVLQQLLGWKRQAKMVA
jgi:hypothetical protein